jgi:uncharacterized membrane protein
MVLRVAENPGRARFYLLVASLALNLALAGVAGAMAVRHAHKTPVPLKPVAGMQRGIEFHLDRIAASLPPNDAQILREEVNAEADKLATAEAAIRLSKEAVRDSLRAEPFDPRAVRAAMAETSTARDHFFRLLHNTFAIATARMSAAGRQRLADWPANRRDNTVVTQ